MRYLSGHKSAIQSLCYSHDGRWLASASAGGEVWLWDPASGLARVLNKGRSKSSFLKASGIFTAADMRELAESVFSHLAGQVPYRALAFSRDGQHLVGGRDWMVSVWDVECDAVSNSLLAPGHHCTDLAFSPDGKLLTSVGPVGLVQSRIFADVRTLAMVKIKSPVAMMENPSHQIRVRPPEQHLTCALGGDVVACELGENMIGLGHVTTRNWEDCIKNTEKICCVKFSPDFRLLAIGGERDVTIWDVTLGSPRPQPRANQVLREALQSILGGPTSPLPPVRDKAQASFLGHEGPVTALAFSPNGRTLFSGSQDGRVRSWDLGHQSPGPVYDWGIGQIWALTVCPDGLTAAIGGDKGEIIIWDVDDAV